MLQKPAKPTSAGRHARHPEEEELRSLLAKQAILFATQKKPIVSRDGRPVPWMFYSWAASLTSGGATLLARAILRRLEVFQSRKLASYGYTGLPLLCSTLLLSQGRYTGLCIRDRIKRYGRKAQLEGSFEPGESVVVIDDSLSSGTSLISAIAALEHEGLTVEGAVVVVNFPWRGGMERAVAHGYHVESVFDIWQDLSVSMPQYSPTWKRVPVQWAEGLLPEGLHPARLARQVALHLLIQGRVPRPPRTLDQEYDCRGGVYISFRLRASDHRVARDGFWHFTPGDALAPRDVVLATVKTVLSARQAIKHVGLERLKIAVSFFTQLEESTLAELDFDKYGIVVRSDVHLNKMGGALPNTQIFTSELEQYDHARFTNARISAIEPHTILRHSVQKVVEPGERWLPYGTHDPTRDAWLSDEEFGRPLAARARELIGHYLRAWDPPDHGRLIPRSVPSNRLWAIAISLYDRGVVGCAVAWGGSIEDCLARACKRALNDPRFGSKRSSIQEDDLAIVISALHDREWLGAIPLEKAARKIRLGLDAILVRQGRRYGMVLPAASVHYSADKVRSARAALREAGISSGQVEWATLQSTSWLMWRGEVARLRFGFPERPSNHLDHDTCRTLVSHLSEFITRHVGPSGLPAYYYDPVRARTATRGTAGRVIHALWALSSAARYLQRNDLAVLAARGVAQCASHVKISNGTCQLRIPGFHTGPGAECQLLIALEATGEQSLSPVAEGLFRRISSMLCKDGSITASGKCRRLSDDHDYLPGVVLLALSLHAKRFGQIPFPLNVEPQLKWYRRRFALIHPWGMVGWHPQAWRQIALLGHATSAADFIFEIADWAVARQNHKTGAFLTSLNPSGPGFNTAFILEGVSAAMAMAHELDDQRRFQRYAECWRRGVQFLDQLVITETDTFCMRDPEAAIGGVRATRDSSGVRIDQVSHTILALVSGSQILFPNGVTS
jgi:orotate phosphoribosyltransferase/AMMECR1 domain-containing protein